MQINQKYELDYETYLLRGYNFVPMIAYVFVINSINMKYILAFIIDGFMFHNSF